MDPEGRNRLGDRVTFKICGSKSFRGYKDKQDHVFVESTRTRATIRVDLEDWDDFMKTVQTLDRHVKTKMR